MPAQIRPVTRNDLLPVAALRRKLFRHTTGQSDEEVARYMDSIFFGNPWYDPALPCYLLEAESGIVGFIGVIPRPMRFRGDAIQGGLVTQLFVEPEHRRTAPVRLLQVATESISGLAIVDAATSGVRRIWEARIGGVAHVYRFFWSQPLWPTRLQGLSDRGSGITRQLKRVVRSSARGLGRLASRGKNGASNASLGKGELVPLSIAEQLPALDAMAGSYPLHSTYTACSLAWILKQANAKWGDHAVHARTLCEDGSVTGSFIFALGEDGTAQVLYAMAEPSRRELLAAHLERSAREAGAVTLEGRFEPVLTPAAEGRACAFRSMGQGVLYRTPDPEIRECVSSGRAVLTGLDGEWWLNV